MMEYMASYYPTPQSDPFGLGFAPLYLHLHLCSDVCIVVKLFLMNSVIIKNLMFNKIGSVWFYFDFCCFLD